MAYVQKLVTADSFDARGVLVPAGHVAVFDEGRLNGDEEHIKDVGDFREAVVEIAPIAPTGPNPKIPQQVPPDAIQAPGGDYYLPGKRLVAEVTDPQEQRIDQPGLRDAENEANVDATLADVMGGAPAPAVSTAGTVKEVTADLGTKTDDQLREMRAAEEGDKNRATVLAAIDKELEGRASQQA